MFEIASACLALTYSIVVFSILGQGLTIGWVVRKAMTRRHA
jgi:NhaP-type Na+/H+ or K+/H+ antiporter